MSDASEPDAGREDLVLLGRALRLLRKRAAMTQEHAGRQLGGDATFVSRIELGKRGARWTTVMRFLRLYGADLHALADAADQARQEQ